MRRVPIRSTWMMLCALATCAAAAEPVGLQLEARIPLDGVHGRIDHLACDAAHRRLFVAELANGTLDLVDLDMRSVRQRVSGLHEPQGIAFSAATGKVYVASGGDGTLRAFSTDDLAPAGSVRVGDDADNVRIDEATGLVYVGYGGGGLAVFDPRTLARVNDIPLPAHPEGFQLAPDDTRIFVNVPDARQIAVVDRDHARAIDAWKTAELRSNYPMAMDAEHARILVVFRTPPAIVGLRMSDGKSLAHATVCGDADDVFVDARRQQVYTLCGAGFVDVLDRDLALLAHIPTAAGARTGLWSGEADRLYVAAPARDGAPAQIQIFRPQPESHPPSAMK